MSETNAGGEVAVRTAEIANKRLDGGVTVGNTVLAPADWQMLSAIAETINGTEFVPVGLRGNAPKVLACMLYGHALGISPMISLKEIAVIDGTPSMSSALMVAKVMERGHEVWREELFEDADDATLMTGVRAHGRRADNGREDTFTFTIPMARRAGLMGKNNWQRYPEAMLWWRSSSQLCSILFPDVFMGSPYMPEELGGDAPPAGAPPHPDPVIGPAIIEVEPPSASEALLAAAKAASPVQPDDGPVLAAASDAQGADTQAAVSPATEPETEATPEREQATDATEAQGEPQAAAETPDANDEPAEEAEGEVVDEPEPPFWTPLDERDPTLDDYEFTKTLLANPEMIEASSDADREEALEAAQVLIDAYEMANPPESVVVAGTIAELMLQVVEAQTQGNREWIAALLDAEKASTKPRIRLVASLQAVLAEMDAPPGEPQGEGETPADAPFEPAADTAAEQLAVNASGHRFDPMIPLADLDHTQLVVRTRALIGYMEDQHPEMTAWQYGNVVTTASKLWKLPVESLGQLEGHNLRKILDVAPPDALEMLGRMSGEQIEALAGRVEGENPS